jgi:hypothetical protein
MNTGIPHRALGIALTLSVLGGCASGRPDWTAPSSPLPSAYGAPIVDLSRYRNVQDRPHQDGSLAFAVSISGGGHRAANYATGLLLGLERIGYSDSNLLHEVDYFSTVSGGSLAAGVYLSERFARRAGHLPSDDFFDTALRGACPEGVRRGAHLPGCSLHALERSYLSPGQRVRPGYADRLEDLIDRWILGRAKHPEAFAGRPHGLTLGDIFPGAYGPDPLLPYWVANATIYSNGAIFPFTPDVLRAYGVSHRVRNAGALPLVEPEDFPVAAAVKASLSYPVLIPGSSLGVVSGDSPGFIRLVDGGMGDNLGSFTAAHLLCQDRPGRGATGAHRRVLLVVDAFPKNGSPYEPRGRTAPPLASLVRSPRLVVDGNRTRHTEVIQLLAARCGFTPIVVSFDDLIDNRADHLGAVDRAACEQITRLPADRLAAALDSLALAELGRRSRGVATRLGSDPREQEQLILAGRLSACLIRARVLAAVAGVPSEPGPSSTRLLVNKSRWQYEGIHTGATAYAAW